MSKSLFLTSTGLSPDVSPFFLNLLKSPPQSTKVAFIPTAGDPYDDKWFVTADLDRLKELGFPVEITDLKEDTQAIQQKLISSEIIYVSGGNTFYLLDWVRKSSLDTYLKQLLEQGRIYVGASAGSILAGPDIDVAQWSPDWDTNDVNLTNSKALNLVPFVISPHFTETERPILESHLPKVDYDIIPITDHQAIYWHDGQWQLVGVGELVKLKNNETSR
jgi:dipeptidase E